jgi:adenylate cyclase
VVPCDIAMVMGEDEDVRQSLCIVEILSSVPINLNKGSSWRYEGTILGRIIQQQRAVMEADPGSLIHPVEKALFSDPSFRNILFIPLKIEGKTSGILMLYNVVYEPLSDTDKILKPLADSFSHAIEKEKLLIAFARRNQEMETLRQIGSALAASTFNMEKVLQHTMEMIQVSMNVEAGSLLLLDKQELEMKVAFNINAAVDPLQFDRLKLGQGIAGYSAARGEAVMVRDVRESKYFDPAFDQKTGFETRSVLCVPLLSQGRVLGVIEVLNKRQGEFHHDDLHLLQSIATTVSIAMENARLYGETLSMAEKERGIRNMFQKFVPREIVDKILLGSEEKTVIDEFKILTLLNIDIRGYSTLSQKVGPQKTVAILNYFFSVMGEIVIKHHGIVDKYLGDGFLALFGAPVSSPMDADNAVSAALDMQKAMEEVSDSLKKRFGASLKMGVSIHTGDAVVGNIGFDKKMDYTVIGDSVNFVFRLQSLCKAVPNGILISEKTYDACQSSLNVEEFEGDLDDSATRMKIYKVIGQEKMSF